MWQCPKCDEYYSESEDNCHRCNMPRKTMIQYSKESQYFSIMENYRGVIPGFATGLTMVVVSKNEDIGFSMIFITMFCLFIVYGNIEKIATFKYPNIKQLLHNNKQ